MTERRVPAAGTGRSVEPGALKIEPVVPTRPNLQHADCGFFDHQRRAPRGRAGCPSAASCKTTSHRRAGALQPGHGTGCGGSFFSAEASCPPSNRPACTRTNARLTRRTGGLGLGRSYSSSGQATDTVDVLRPELGLVHFQAERSAGAGGVQLSDSSCQLAVTARIVSLRPV